MRKIKDVWEILFICGKNIVSERFATYIVGFMFAMYLYSQEYGDIEYKQEMKEVLRLAADAVLKVKEAEDNGSEVIKRANEVSKDILKNAEADAQKKCKAILDEAYRMKAEIIEAASKKAAEECNGLILKGDEEKEKVLHPDKAKFDRASDLIVERIVNLNGHR